MQYWLLKTEPDSFSWTQQTEREFEPWNGVRNFTAKSNLQAMKKGDLAFFYHSNIGKEIVGIVRVVREAYPDPTAAGVKGGWVCVDVKAVKPVPKPVTLATVKADPRFSEMALVKYSRLSVSPVSAEHWAMICEMGGVKA